MMPTGELLALLRRSQGFACDTFRRPPDWSPARDLDVCACGASLGHHAMRLLADRLEADRATKLAVPDRG